MAYSKELRIRKRKQHAESATTVRQELFESACGRRAFHYKKSEPALGPLFSIS